MGQKKNGIVLLLWQRKLIVDSFAYNGILVNTLFLQMPIDEPPKLSNMCVDHSPSGSPHPARRAVQLGLKGLASFADGSDIVAIQDFTPFVNHQAQVHKLIISPMCFDLFVMWFSQYLFSLLANLKQCVSLVNESILLGDILSSCQPTYLLA
jgi:hypothetical protein